MAQTRPVRAFVRPEVQVLHAIVDRAEELNKLEELAPVVIDWYKQHIDRHGFAAGGELGPEVPHAQK